MALTRGIRVAVGNVNLDGETKTEIDVYPTPSEPASDVDLYDHRDDRVPEHDPTATHTSTSSSSSSSSSSLSFEVMPELVSRQISDTLARAASLSWRNRLGPGGGPQALNPVQRLAVATILSRAHGDVPFCLCGPPGTGKTLTLVESILHVHAARPTARILVAASIEPYSADLLAHFLLVSGVAEDRVLRVQDPRWPLDRVHEGARPLCALDHPGRIFKLPSPDELLARPILVTSLSVLALLQDRAKMADDRNDIEDDCQQQHQQYHNRSDNNKDDNDDDCLEVEAQHPAFQYDYVFVDEAGQATIPQTLVAAHLVAKGGTLVLGGDPKQLGPVVRSPLARAHGLHVSLLEGLMDNLAGFGPATAKAADQTPLSPYTVNVLAEALTEASIDHHGPSGAGRATSTTIN